ncbi:hypothetical protein BDZ91DRAFT_659180 [Kalaharituber pfeilii]|nr:hypothetical protein BDZ91DRAFT_659180 [Kalaharituber pfeilii]
MASNVTHSALAPTGRRTLFSSSSSKKKPKVGPKTFKSALLRWALAIAGTYYYLTGSIFAEETTFRFRSRNTGAISDPQDLRLITASEAGTTQRPGSIEEVGPTEGTIAGEPVSPEDLEAEADQQGAFNPETGEINWDCPCLGGMAHGPCGEEFKSAFSCFVHSTEEPKGMDCIDNFKTMQDCFRKFPEVYGAELDTDEKEDESEEGSPEITAEDEQVSASKIPSTPPSSGEPAVPVTAEQVQEKVKAEVPAQLDKEKEVPAQLDKEKEVPAQLDKEKEMPAQLDKEKEVPAGSTK